MATYALAIGTGAGGVGSTATTLVMVSTAEQSAETYRAVLTNASSPLYVQSIDLASGLNTITIPSTAGGVIVQPPTSNSQTITLKGVTGDTGIAVGKAFPIMLTFNNPPPANFVLTTGGAIAGCKFTWL